jgi:hypothetical protein
MYGRITFIFQTDLCTKRSQYQCSKLNILYALLTHHFYVLLYKTELFPENMLYKTSSYLTRNKLRLHYTRKPVKAVSGNKILRQMFESKDIYIYEILKEGIYIYIYIYTPSLKLFTKLSIYLIQFAYKQAQRM